jgi:cysteine desulfurase / selenocysteine lyase
MFDVNTIRSQFPILARKIRGKEFIYFDNAATTLKPQRVIDRVSTHYAMESANIHRGVHYLSELGTMEYEKTRETVRAFLNAKESKEIIFTKGTTDCINLVANGFATSKLKSGDEIMISTMEHHSNIVPWQLAAEKVGAKIVEIPINIDGDILIDEYKKLLSSKTKIVSIVAISNTLGTINPIKEMISLAHEAGAEVMVDGAQAVAHQGVDVQDLDCDYFAFSGHKIFGPTGIGILYGKEKLLEALPPYQGGGDMIDKVTIQKTTYNELPFKFEAGTPNIAGGIALNEAIEFVNDIGLDKIAKYEDSLLTYATKKLLEIDALTLIGTAKKKASVNSFIIKDVHPHDLGTLLDQQGIAVRTGHHCTQPLMDFYKIPATTRASYSVYNTMEEIDGLVMGIKKAKELL